MDRETKRALTALEGRVEYLKEQSVKDKLRITQLEHQVADNQYISKEMLNSKMDTIIIQLTALHKANDNLEERVSEIESDEELAFSTKLYSVESK